MLIFVRGFTCGQNGMIEVERDETILSVKKKYCRLKGYDLFDREFCFASGGNVMKSGNWHTPPLKEEECKNERFCVVGKGDKWVNVMFLNCPNFFVSFKYSSPKEVENLIKEFYTTISKKLSHEHSKDRHGGRRCFFHSGGDLISCHYSIEDEDPSQPEKMQLVYQQRDFEYYEVKNEILTILVREYVDVEKKTLADYNVGNEDSIDIYFSFGFNLQRDVTTWDFESHEKVVPNFSDTHRGINVACVCKFPSCKSSGKEIIYPFSRNILFENYRHSVEEWRSVTFDYHYDRVYLICPFCSMVMIPVKLVFEDCFWKVYARLNRNKERRYGTDWRISSKEKSEEFELKEGKYARLQTQIIVKPPEIRHCRICRGYEDTNETCSENNLGRECGHFCHEECRKKWKIECVICQEKKLVLDVFGDEKECRDERDRIGYLMEKYCKKENFESEVMKIDGRRGTYVPKILFLL